MFAHEERNLWRQEMKEGKVPAKVRQAITLYREQREKTDWRASRTYECLGEAALLWLEEQEEKERNV